MDKHILLVESDIDSTKALANKDMVSFHKQPRICFNRTTLERAGIKPGMLAQFIGTSIFNRKIYIQVFPKEVLSQPNVARFVDTRYQKYKLTNPKINSRNEYCYLRTTSLLYDFDLICKGAFEYSVKTSSFSKDIKYIEISF